MPASSTSRKNRRCSPPRYPARPSASSSARPGRGGRAAYKTVTTVKNDPRNEREHLSVSLEIPARVYGMLSTSGSRLGRRLNTRKADGAGVTASPTAWRASAAEEGREGESGVRASRCAFNSAARIPSPPSERERRTRRRTAPADEEDKVRGRKTARSRLAGSRTRRPRGEWHPRCVATLTARRAQPRGYGMRGGPLRAPARTSRGGCFHC